MDTIKHTIGKLLKRWYQNEAYRQKLHYFLVFSKLWWHPPLSACMTVPEMMVMYTQNFDWKIVLATFELQKC